MKCSLVQGPGFNLELMSHHGWQFITWSLSCSTVSVVHPWRWTLETITILSSPWRTLSSHRLTTHTTSVYFWMLRSHSLLVFPDSVMQVCPLQFLVFSLVCTLSFYCCVLSAEALELPTSDLNHWCSFRMFPHSLQGTRFPSPNSTHHHRSRH